MRCESRLALVEESPAGVRQRLHEGVGAVGRVAELVLDRGMERRGKLRPVAPRHSSHAGSNGYSVRMETERTPDTPATEERKSPEELAEEVKQENPDPT